VLLNVRSAPPGYDRLQEKIGSRQKATVFEDLGQWASAVVLLASPVLPNLVRLAAEISLLDPIAPPGEVHLVLAFVKKLKDLNREDPKNKKLTTRKTGKALINGTYFT